jgi:hypothetical protein
MKARRTLMATSARARASRRMLATWADAQAPIEDQAKTRRTDDAQLDLEDAIEQREPETRR